jgi:hypothetical protein
MRKDTLQGGLRPQRTCFNVLHYDLNIKINPEEKYIVGYNDITFGMEGKSDVIQLDLFENMKVDSIFIGTVGVENDVIFTLKDGKKIKVKGKIEDIWTTLQKAIQK